MGKQQPDRGDVSALPLPPPPGRPGAPSLPRPPPPYWAAQKRRAQWPYWLAIGVPAAAVVGFFGIVLLFLYAWGQAHGPIWDNELIRVSEADDEGLCFVGDSQPGREWCYSFDEAPSLASLDESDCARISGSSMSFVIEEVQPEGCPDDVSRLVPEVPVLPATEVGRLESRDLAFDFVEARSDFGRWCGGAVVRENGVVVSQATYEVDDTWWVCWGRSPEMNALDEPEVEVFEDVDALETGTIIVGWAPREITEVLIHDGDEELRFDVTTTGGRFGTLMTTTPENWTLTVSSRSGEVWACPWIVDGGVQCRNR